MDRLIEWADRWQMKFNVAICKVMCVATSNTNSSYNLGGLQIETTDTEKVLGIISNNLKTTKQCINVEKKCNYLLGYIKRHVRYKNKKIVVTLYNTLVLPHLQYCIEFWSPSLSYQKI